jgi:hypothetical protein
MSKAVLRHSSGDKRLSLQGCLRLDLGGHFATTSVRSTAGHSIPIRHSPDQVGQ